MSLVSLSEASIQPRTSTSKFENDFIHLFIRLLTQKPAPRGITSGGQQRRSPAPADRGGRVAEARECVSGPLPVSDDVEDEVELAQCPGRARFCAARPCIFRCKSQANVPDPYSAASTNSLIHKNTQILKSYFERL